VNHPHSYKDVAKINRHETHALPPRPNRKKQIPIHVTMETTITKIQKHLDALKARNDKLAAENQKLKGTIAEMKSLNSRVRRIPKAAQQ